MAPALKEIPANTIILFAEPMELVLYVALKAIPVVTLGHVVRIISVNQMGFVQLVGGMILHVVKGGSVERAIPVVRMDYAISAVTMG